MEPDLETNLDARVVGVKERRWRAERFGTFSSSMCRADLSFALLRFEALVITDVGSSGLKTFLSRTVM